MARPRTSKPLGDDCRRCGEDDWIVRPNKLGRACAACARKRTAKYHLKNAAASMLDGAKRRARKAGVPCTITIKDFTIPVMCPVLGVPLKKGGDGGNWQSPSLDRIDPEKGYVPGNIVVMSRRANLIKSSATPEEVLKVAHWMNRVARNARRS